jgi:hypothetical protein
MKIEIGESILIPWLRHVKKCQIVQTNWKPSFLSWKLKKEKALQKLMTESDFVFRENYDYEIYRKTSSFEELIQQAKIDILGIAFDNDDWHIYAFNAAYHEDGLDYGSEEDTVIEVLNMMLSAAMCIYGYFGWSAGDIIFASPKMNKNTMDILKSRLNHATILLRKNGFRHHLQLMANRDFNEMIIQPVLAVSASVGGTTEFIARRLYEDNLFADDKQAEENRGESKTGAGDSDNVSPVEQDGIYELSGMKIGALVQTVLLKMFSNNEVSRKEVELMQTFHYSRKTFDIQYPLLVKVSSGNGQAVPRYWPEAVDIYGEKYFICSEWFETPQNNDREYFMKWLEDKESNPRKKQ